MSKLNELTDFDLNAPLHIDAEYKDRIKTLGERLGQSQMKAALKVNGELLSFCWMLGKVIVDMNIESRWGTNVIKVAPFDSSFAGQLGTYVVAVNHQLKGECDAQTIGILACKGLDKVEAQYALESSSRPIGIPAYELSKLIPEKFKSSLPTLKTLKTN